MGMGWLPMLLKSSSVAWGREEKGGGRRGHVHVEAGEGGQGGLAQWSAARGGRQRPLTVGRERRGEWD
jgi:hypothetical protein